METRLSPEQSTDTDTPVESLPVGPPPARGIRFGRYELLRCLGSGATGEVFLAREAASEGFEKLLVIKVLRSHPPRDPEYLRTFLEEARFASRLDHVNIARVLDCGASQGAYFVAAEYVHGEDVRRVDAAARARGRPIPLPYVARIVADAAAGLGFAHDARDGEGRALGIVHRDVSPQNLLVGFDGVVKVADFGIAKAAGRSFSDARTGALADKCAYLSPEQVRAEPLDGRSDLFSLGVVLFELATGRRLFERESVTATCDAVGACEVPSPRSINPKIDPLFEGIILRTLARERAERFPDAGALRLAIDSWLVRRREPVSAAQLGALVQELFQERLAQEQCLGAPLARRQEVASALAPSRAGAKSGRAKARALAPWVAAVGGVAVVAAVGLGLWMQPKRPDLAELQAIYPYGWRGAVGPRGEVAPGAMRVGFKLVGEAPCGSHTTCLRYQYSDGNRFEGTMLVREQAGGGWITVSSEGMPFKVSEPVRNEESGPARPTVARAGTPEAERLFEQGMDLFKVQKKQDAAGWFRRAIAADPTFAKPHLYLGVCLGAEGQADAAAREFEESLHLAPDDPNAPNIARVLRDFVKQKPDFELRWPLPPSP